MTFEVRLKDSIKANKEWGVIQEVMVRRILADYYRPKIVEEVMDKLQKGAEVETLVMVFRYNSKPPKKEQLWVHDDCGGEVNTKNFYWECLKCGKFVFLWECNDNSKIERE